MSACPVTAQDWAEAAMTAAPFSVHNAGGEPLADGVVQVQVWVWPGAVPDRVCRRVAEQLDQVRPVGTVVTVQVHGAKGR